MGGFLTTSIACALFDQQQAAPVGYGLALLKMVAALVVVCILAYVLLRLLRRRLAGSGSAGRLLRVLDRCSLSTRQSLWVVEVSGRFFLLGATDGSIVKLAELDRDLVDTDSRPKEERFWDVLKRVASKPGRGRES